MIPNKRYLSFAALGLLFILIATLFHYLPALVQSGHSIRQAQFKILWSHTSKKQILTSPILVDGAVAFGTYDGHLEALSSKDGKILWSLKLTDSVFSITAGEPGVVYAGTGLHDSKTGWMNAVDAATGKIIWQREFTGHLEEPPLVEPASHRLWLGAGPGSLWALNSLNGNVLWHREIGHLDATPLLSQDVIYVPAQKSEELHETFFYALRPSDGEVLWKIDQPGQPWAAPVADKTGEIILATTGIGQIGVARDSDKGWAQAVSREGKALWQSDLPSMPLTPHNYIPELDLAVYVTKKGKVTALNVKDGSALWTVQAARSFSAQGVPVPGFKEKLITVISDDGILSLLDASNGDVVYTRKIAPSAIAAPFVHQNIIYITTTFGVTAIGIL